MLSEPSTETMENTQTEKLKYYLQLTKPRLSGLVVFSGIFGFLYAQSAEPTFKAIASLSVGSYLITGAANTLNQILEVEYDKLMKRTASRPLPTGKLSVKECLYFSILLTLIGSLLLFWGLNLFCSLLSLTSLVLYAFVYTPLKRKTPFSVAVGAIPGALPPLIGWVAATDAITHEALVIFAIQFIWQFPHFWAIAWVGHEDYHNAGFKMLPFGDSPGTPTAIQISLYTLFLIPLGLLPSFLGMNGVITAVVNSICALFFLWSTINLIKHGTTKKALQIMFASFIYLPVVQLVMLFDRI